MKTVWLGLNGKPIGKPRATLFRLRYAPLLFSLRLGANHSPEAVEPFHLGIQNLFGRDHEWYT